MLFCSGYAAGQGGIPTQGSPAPRVVKLPIIEKQDIRFTRFLADGESFETGSKILSVAQDNYGFLWFAGHGLQRYDGYRLKSYWHDPTDPNSLSEDAVTVVIKDRTGVLWAGTLGGGLDRLDVSLDKITHYRHQQGDDRSLSSDEVHSIYQDRSGILWIGTTAGLDALDLVKGTFLHYRHSPQDAGSISGGNVGALYEDREGRFWVGTEQGLNMFDRATGKFFRFLPDPADPRSLGHNHVSRIIEDHLGVLWVGIGSWLSRLDVATGKFTLYSFHAEEPGAQSVAGVASLYEDRDGALWIGTIDRGLLKLDRERKNFSRYAQQPNDPNSFPNDQVPTLFGDAEGVLWISTAGGLISFPPKPSSFVNYTGQDRNRQNLGSTSISSVLADSQGSIWMGAGVLTRLDRRTGQFTSYHHDPKDARSIAGAGISSMIEDSSGILWFGTYGGGLSRFDRSTGRFFTYRHEPKHPESLSSDLVVSLLEDRHGLLWVGTQLGGLNRFDRATGRFTSWLNDPNDPSSFARNNVLALFEGRDGILWLGTQDGLVRFDPGTEQFRVYRHNAQDPHSLSQNRVNAIREDRNGTLWVGTRDGLNQMDRGRGSFTSFTKRDGLPDSSIQAIQEDGQGYLWLATSNGLSRFQPQSRSFRNYSVSDRLPGNYFGSSFRTKSGEMIFGSTSAITTFYPDRLSDNPYVPPVVLTDFLLFNAPVRQGRDSQGRDWPLRKPIWAADSLTLTDKQSIFTFEFAALSYAAPEKNRYRYRLAGLETDWNEVDSRQRLATYTNLSHGKYVFQLQGSNNDGVWNPKITTLAITVLPPWWATWWFISIAGLTTAALVFAAYRSRIRGLQLAGIRLETQVAERTHELAIAKNAAERANKAKSSFLAHMSHELRTPLNAILGFSAVVRDSPGLSERDREDLDTVRRSGEHLLGLIDDVLDTAKIEAGRVTITHTSFDLGDLVGECVVMMRLRASAKGVELLLHSDPVIPRFVRSDAGKLRQVLVNLIGNAVKFTERGSVTVRLNARREDASPDTLLVLEVEDTGIGISPEDQARIFDVFVQVSQTSAQKGTGLGLSITQQFVHMMGGSIHVESSLGKGSLFRVELPVQQFEEPEAVAATDDHGQVAGLAPGQRSYRILIVEDKRENWLLLQRVLEDAGFQVQVAEDGARGIELFRAWQPHLIWMDVRLPAMGGLEAARRIRALEGGRLVKIVALTASASAQQREEVMAAGLDDFLRKPYRREEIFDCMSRHLGLQYIYKEGPPARPAEPVAALRPETISLLPETLRKELADALVRLDPGPIGEIIGRVSQQDAQLGEVLSRLARRLAYTEILDALMNCDVRVREEAP